MADMAVMVIDPGGFRFAQLIDDRQRVRQVIPIFVERLGLPRDLTYELVPTATSHPLAADATLAGAYVKPGAELILRPVRNGLFQKLLDKLYDEAKEFVIGKIWDLAKERLKAIFRLDPAYPDRDRLREALQRAGVDVGNMQPNSPPPLRGVSPPEGEGIDAGNAVDNAVGNVTGNAAGNASTGASGSSVVGCLVVVVLVGAALVYWQPWTMWQTWQAGQRPGEPKLGTGDVQVTLRWHNAADLDLRVTDPEGQQVWFGNRTVPSGGHLDVDANDRCQNNVMANPVENVYWPTGRAPHGDYQVVVQYTIECNHCGPADFDLTVVVKGRVLRTERGTLRPGENKNVVAFRY